MSAGDDWMRVMEDGGYEVRKYDHNVDRGPVRQAKWILSRSGSGSKIDDSR